MRDLYRGDGGRLSSYDEGWNDGVEAAEKAIRAEVEGMREDAEPVAKWLDDQPFYEVCQAYRHAGIVHQDVVVERYEQLKDFIREQMESDLEQARALAIAECARVCDDADKSTHPADLADRIRARGEHDEQH